MQDREIASSTRKPAGPKTRAKDETDALEASIASAAKALCAIQRADGHFVFELEADATIPAEYVLMCHFLLWRRTSRPDPCQICAVVPLSRRAGGRRNRNENCALSPPHSIRRW